MNEAVAWLEAEFEQRPHRFVQIWSCRPLFELVDDDSDGESLASWPDPMPGDDLDDWDDESEVDDDEWASFVSAAEARAAHTVGTLQ